MHTSISKWQKSQDDPPPPPQKKGEKKGKKQSTVNVYINIEAFHTHWNNHKYYKIMHILISTWQTEKHKYCYDNQKSTI